MANFSQHCYEVIIWRNVHPFLNVASRSQDNYALTPYLRCCNKVARWPYGDPFAMMLPGNHTAPVTWKPFDNVTTTLLEEHITTSPWRVTANLARSPYRDVTAVTLPQGCQKTIWQCPLRLSRFCRMVAWWSYCYVAAGSQRSCEIARRPSSAKFFGTSPQGCPATIWWQPSATIRGQPFGDVNIRLPNRCYITGAIFTQCHC